MSNRSAQGFLLTALAATMLVPVVGCGQRVSREELGEVHFEIPKVPGADQPFPLPSDLPDQPPGGRDPAGG